MNKLVIIGNLTKDPELKSTQQGIPVCSFTIAVNRRKGADARDEADFFRITAWKALADNCARFLQKGRKVCVVGSVGVSAYKTSEGEARASLEVTADEVEFLTAADRQEAKEPADQEPKQIRHDVPDGFIPVNPDDLGELPF